MKPLKITFFFIPVFILLAAYSQLKKSHNFTEETCDLCHFDIKQDASALKPMDNFKCEICHTDRRETLSHPFDIVPEMSIPSDLPLVDGKMTCSTCHFTHPFSMKSRLLSFFLLRRPGRGITFCTSCHKTDEKGHLLYGTIHKGTYEETNHNNTIDNQTLQCIECHGSHLTISKRSVGAGRWTHGKSQVNHAVGSVYESIVRTKPRDFHPKKKLSSNIRFFNGKIGCGTCHNVYSKEKSMLVVNNKKSRLCLECHNK